VFMGMSLDGCIAGPNGEIDWLDRVRDEGEDYGYHAFWASITTLVIGRGTWDVARGFSQWPYDGKRVVVLTHRPEPPEHGEEFYSGDVRGLALEGRAYIDGGNVIRQFLAAGLIDDLTLTIVPLILGDGIRLFDRGIPTSWLTLQEHRAWPSGLAQLRYVVQRP
jgi:dihydrofolate reductase